MTLTSPHLYCIFSGFCFFFACQISYWEAHSGIWPLTLFTWGFSGKDIDWGGWRSKARDRIREPVKKGVMAGRKITWAAEKQRDKIHTEQRMCVKVGIISLVWKKHAERILLWLEKLYKFVSHQRRFSYHPLQSCCYISDCFRPLGTM